MTYLYHLALLLAKSTFSLSGVATIIGAVAAVGVLVFAAIYAVRYVKATGAQAELEAKDDIIKTNQQTIEALDQRLRTLIEEHEETVRRLKAAENLIRSMKGTIEERDAQYEALKQYTAPGAVKEMRGLMEAQTEMIVTAFKETTAEVLVASHKVAQEVAAKNLAEISNRLAQIQHELNPKHVYAQTPSAGMGSWWWDTKRQEMPHWSDEMFRMLGLSEKIDATEFRKHVAPEDQDRYDQVLKQAMRDKQPFDYTYTWIRPDDSRRIRIRSRGDYINSEKRRMVGTLEDVTATTQP